MQELNGKECPKLFGKWQPLKFTDFFCDENPEHYHNYTPRLNQKWDFPFAIVSVESSDIYYPDHHISAHGLTQPGNCTVDELFEPKILEMFYDAKEYMAEKLRKMSLMHESLKLVDIKDHSAFGRKTGFHITVEYKKLPGGFKNIEGQLAICKEIYESLEDALMREFGAGEEAIYPNYILPGFPPSGTLKEVELVQGAYFCTESPLPDDINAGTMYMYVVSDEHGKKENHAAILDFSTRYIQENFSEKLHSVRDSVVYMGIAGDCAGWKIDLSALKFPRRLAPSTVFAGMLESGTCADELHMLENK
ncbi:hypothetical protein ACFL6I_22400 [candidate division KSB1 bacterium]